MANNYSTLSALFTAIANAIRAKTGSTEKIVADNFPSAIAGISSSTTFTRYMHTITASGSFVVPATGKYRVTAIGKGADGYAYEDSTTQYNGGCGGGGGKSTTYYYKYSGEHYIYGNGGKGGAACIFIERLS